MIYSFKNRDGNVLRCRGKLGTEAEARALALVARWTIAWPVEVWVGEEIEGAPRWTLEAAPAAPEPTPPPAPPSESAKSPKPPMKRVAKARRS